MAKRRKVNNLMALGILAMLVPGTPMHPYEIASVLRRTGKERDMQIKWGSLYTVVQNLDKHGFIIATGVDREGRRPERTTYELTDEGRAELQDWLQELVTDPEPDQSRFTAALSVAGVLTPDELIPLLTERLRGLVQDVEARRLELADGAKVPRLFLIESEYALAMRVAEANWVRGLLAELSDGSFPDLAAWRSYHETGVPPPGWAELLAEEG